MFEICVSGHFIDYYEADSLSEALDLAVEDVRDNYLDALELSPSEWAEIQRGREDDKRVRRARE